tara:strand:- start:324 stop:740 length:417 start_codon:yes stop_codon:yes gene_type:complete
MDNYTQMFLSKLLDPNTFFLGITFLLTGSSMYHLYLLNKMFHIQQETLQENQQHQYQIYQDLIKLVIKSPPSNYSQTSENNPLEVLKSIEQPPVLPSVTHSFESNKNKGPSDSIPNNNNSIGFLDELKTVLKRRENSP